MAAVRLRSIVRVAALSIAALTAVSIVGVLSLSLLVDFEDARKQPVPKGVYHAWVCLRTGCNPFKVINPADSRFEHETFRFEDYETDQQLGYVLSHIIAPGMARNSVERMLVVSGGATVFASPDGTIVQYTYPNKADIWKSGKFALQVYYSDGVYVRKLTVRDNEVKLHGGDS